MWSDLFDRSVHPSGWNPLVHERIPRLIVLIASGVSLVTSGIVIQALFQNPLASPSLLGMNVGGALMATLIFLLDLRFSHPYLLPMAAIVGSLAAVCLVYTIAWAHGGARLAPLILTGLALSTLLISVHSFVLYSIREQWQYTLAITEWMAGSTFNRGWHHVHMQLPLTLVGCVVCWNYREELNLLSLGEDEAMHLGVDVARVRWRLFLAVSLLVGGTLAALGVLPFFELLLPHILRKVCGADHRALLPVGALGGATSLVVLDVLLRTFHITSTSLGHLSALLGGTFFLFLLFQQKHPREGLEWSSG